MGLVFPLLPGLIAPLLILLDSNDHPIGNPPVVIPASTSSIGNVDDASDRRRGFVATIAAAAAAADDKDDDDYDDERRYDDVKSWDLPNGSVRFDDPFRFPLDFIAMSREDGTAKVASPIEYELRDPTFLGRYGDARDLIFTVGAT